jgi:hypothetical protein
MELTNTGAIPLDFCWHMADEASYTARDFTVLPATGTVLPRAKQTIQVNFQPQSVQHYNLSLVMDIPEVINAAAKVLLKGECAVPIIKLADGNEMLQFGEVFVHYPYSQQFTLLNDSKLPAKFEVLQQVCSHRRVPPAQCQNCMVAWLQTAAERHWSKSSSGRDDNM